LRLLRGGPRSQHVLLHREDAALLHARAGACYMCGGRAGARASSTGSSSSSSSCVLLWCPLDRGGWCPAAPARSGGATQPPGHSRDTADPPRPRPGHAGARCCMLARRVSGVAGTSSPARRGQHGHRAPHDTSSNQLRRTNYDLPLSARAREQRRQLRQALLPGLLSQAACARAPATLERCGP